MGSAVTDGTGQYRLVDLRPGTYTVTFTLTGFVIVKREGIELEGSFTATIGVDLYNALNSAAVLTYNQTYNPTSSTWLTPTSVMTARFVKISALIDF